jgi:hypothetical protein
VYALAMQHRIREWVETRLGKKAMEPKERATRVLEEAIELAQACGVDEVTASRLITHVFAKPTGEIAQELGGAALTLLACAESTGHALDLRALIELDRIETLPVERFRSRQQQNVDAGIGAPVEVE